MKNLISITILLLLTQCRNDKVINIDTNKFFEINYEKTLENKKTVKLSEIASEVRYITLETGNNFLIFRNPAYYFSENFIFVSNLDHILVYDYTGKFIRKIGKGGRGPGEIDLIRLISIIEKEQIIAVQTNWSHKIMYFSFDGEFIKSIPVPADVYRVRVLNNNRFILNFSCSQGFEDYLYILSNEKWDTISSVNNHFKWTNNTGITGMWGVNDYRLFYNFRNQTYFKSMYNDTVFTVVDSKIKPAYFINLGKYRLPNELRPEPPQSALRFRMENDKYFFANVMEAGKFIFITSQNYKVNVQKNILFDNNTKEWSLLVNESNNPSRIFNDWDGGAEFWPEGNINDNEIFMAINSLTLKEMLSESDFRNKPTQFPGKQESLKEMIEKLDETDNPVLMLVKLKE